MVVGEIRPPGENRAPKSAARQRRTFTMREDGNDVDDVPVGASGAGRGEVVAQRGGAGRGGSPAGRDGGARQAHQAEVAYNVDEHPPQRVTRVSWVPPISVAAWPRRPTCDQDLTLPKTS